VTSPCSPSTCAANRLGTVALLTALAFGCTTIRAPVAMMSSSIPIHEGRADPQLALWLESANPIKPEEAAQATARARAALDEALAGRQVGDGSTVLVVRAQGVTRTASHKSDQVAATVAIVLTAVIVVIGVVLWLSKGGSGKGGDAPASDAPRVPGFGKAGARPPPRSPALPVAAAARPPPVGSPRPPPPGMRPPVGPDHGPSVAVGVGVELGPFPVEGPDAGSLQVISSRELSGPGQDPEGAPPDQPQPAASPAVEALLPLATPPDFEDRGFFASDLTVLELTLVDRLTGEPRWTKWVEASVDPCDAEALRQVLDKALAEAEGWAPPR
jgi:hypothetical protein